MRARLPAAAVSALVCGFLCGAVGRAADWPQLQGNAAHTGYTSDQPGPPYRLKWKRDLQEPTQSAAQPVVAEDKIFVGTGRGNLLALSRADGKTLWTYKTAAPIFGSAAYADGVVYANSLDRRLHAVRASDGTEVWTFETGAPIWAAPVLADGKVFIGGRDGFVYSVEAATGREAWRSPIPNLVMCTPAWADGSTVSMPDAPSLVRAFGRAGNRHGRSRFPVARITFLTRWGVEAVTAYRLGPYREAESVQFRALWDHLPRGAICLFDKHFTSFYNLAKLPQRGVDCLGPLNACPRSPNHVRARCA